MRTRALRRAPPAAGPAVATSSGLRWNLAATRLAMGHLVRHRLLRRRMALRCGGGELTRCRVVALLLPQVSTSNAVVAPEVRVQTDAPLVWTTQLHFDAAAQQAAAASRT